MSKRTLTPDDLRAAKNLKRIWKRDHKALKLTQQKAADILDCNQSAISQYLNGRIALGMKAMLGFCKMLQIDPLEIRPELDFFLPHNLQLLNEAGENYKSDVPHVTLLDNVLSTRPLEVLQSYLNNPSHEKVGLDPKLAAVCSPMTFALNITDDSMVPEFVIGDIAIIDPNIQASEGDVVLAKLTDDPAAIIRYYKPTPNNPTTNFILSSANDTVANVEVSEGSGRIVGVLIERRSLRRSTKS